MTSNTDSPKSFAELGLHPRLLNGLDSMQLTQPTPVQSQSIPAILAGHDVITSAVTGSGKSLAFLLPMLSVFMHQPQPQLGCRGLVLVPTRELADQLATQLKRIHPHSHVTFTLLTGGADFNYQAAELRKNPEIIVATPGRMSDHLRRNSTNLQDLEFLVLDEADRMLDLGFAEDIDTLVMQARPERQSLLFSATLNHAKVKAVANKLLREPVAIAVDAGQSANTNIIHEYVLTDDSKHKQKLLQKLIKDCADRPVLVFANTKAETNRLRGVLDYYDFTVGCLHGDMTQDQRNQILGAFRARKFQVLVATDVAARGLDIPELATVIQFDMARKPEDYIHRAGRTGRAGKSGLSIALISANDWDNKARAENAVGVAFTQRNVPGLKAKYKGPKRVKSSGKAGSSKRKPATSDKAAAPKPKVKSRARDQANKGRPKRFGPAPSKSDSGTKPGELGDGFAPLKRK